MGTECNAMSQTRSGTKDLQLADHVLQFSYTTFSGFRFPIGHFPSNQATAGQLYHLVWKAVSMLDSIGFDVTYISMDGASSNRTFFDMNFPEKNAVAMRMSARSPIGTPNVLMIMDYSHVVKKIRNSVCSSSINGKRLLQKQDGKFITWSQWEQAYEWDQMNIVSLHRHLTRDHIYNLSNSNKMRNHLAEQVLNMDMLNLMLAFKTTLGSNGSKLDATIAFLQNTSILVEVFRDSRAITGYDDTRVTKVRKVYQWFKEWETWSMKRNARSFKEKESALLTSQARQDLDSCLLGFDELAKTFQSICPGFSLLPCIINSDSIENLFCQQRAIHNGANQNPTYAAYKKAVNAITLLQPVISRKANSKAPAVGAKPLTFLRQKRNSSPKPTGSTKKTRHALLDKTNRL